MDKIDKALQKLSSKEKEGVKQILVKIQNNDFTNLDIKKLKGRQDIYRVRKGKIRVIYCVNNNQLFILTIERKNNNTYKI